jgi:hypothetical protein
MRTFIIVILTIGLVISVTLDYLKGRLFDDDGNLL